MSYLTRQEIDQLRRLPLPELLQLSSRAKVQHRSDQFALCSILNAKSGRCSENCSFCVQSTHHSACTPPIYPLKTTTEIVAAALEARAIGAHHFSIVTSGRGPSSREIGLVAEAIAAIRQAGGITPCASLGIMRKEELQQLREAGLARYHQDRKSVV